MAVKRTSKNNTNNKNSKTNSIDYKELIETQIKKKYFYLLLGLTIFIVGYFLVSSLFNKNQTRTLEETKKTEAMKAEAEKKAKSYVVKTGDYLWKIAEQNYGSGYNAYDIAKANNIKDPNVIYSGIRLIIPDVSPKTPTKGEIAQAVTGKVTITAANYKVKTGDSLWKISLEAYGDGYAWTKIFKANKIVNPDVIYPGSNLKIPR